MLETGVIIIKINTGGFHLNLLVFTFVNQINSRIRDLVHSSLENLVQKDFSNILASFKNLFVVVFT